MHIISLWNKSNEARPQTVRKTTIQIELLQKSNCLLAVLLLVPFITIYTVKLKFLCRCLLFNTLKLKGQLYTPCYFGALSLPDEKEKRRILQVFIDELLLHLCWCQGKTSDTARIKRYIFLLRIRSVQMEYRTAFAYIIQ